MNKEKKPPLTDDDLMPCGKYKGKKMSEVPDEYYIWMYKKWGKDNLIFRFGEMGRVMAYVLRSINNIHTNHSINVIKNFDYRAYFGISKRSNRYR